MEIFEEKIFFKSVNTFFSRVQSTSSLHNYSADNVVQLSDINIFEDCKCNVSVYMKNGNAFYVAVGILNQSEKKEDMIASFLKIENKLDSVYGKTLLKQGKLAWALFENAWSKRKINNAVIEHRLYEHFGFRESITVKLT